METFVQYLAVLGPVGLFIIMALVYILRLARGYILRVKAQRAEQDASVSLAFSPQAPVAPTQVPEAMRMLPEAVKLAAEHAHDQRLAVQKVMQDVVTAIDQDIPASYQISLKKDGTVETVSTLLPSIPPGKDPVVSMADISVINEHTLPDAYAEPGTSRRVPKWGCAVRKYGIRAYPMTSAELDSKIAEAAARLLAAQAQQPPAPVVPITGVPAVAPDTLSTTPVSLDEQIKQFLPNHRQEHEQEAKDRNVPVEQVEREFIALVLRSVSTPKLTA
jgi:hypothetical protein